MSYIRELDDLPWEVRRSTAATLYYWPKVDGSNVAVSATASHNQYEVLQPNGTVIQARGNATVDTVNGVSRLTISIPAITTLDERYHAHLTSALELESLTVGDVVTPNDHLAAVGPTADTDEIQTAGRTSGHLRLLVRDDASAAPVRGVTFPGWRVCTLMGG